MDTGDFNQGYSPLKAALAVTAIAAVVTLARMWGDIQPQPQPQLQSAAAPAQINRPVTPRGGLTAEETNATGIFESVSPSVVFISSVALERDIFTQSVYEIPQGTGSGFVWDEQGHILTNFHVIVDAGRIEVTMSDGSKWKARLVGRAPDRDLAVLKIDAPAGKLRPIPIGDSKNLKVGQTVYAIGNPFGLDKTMTSGIVSALNRQIQSLSGRMIQGVIQSDAAINPGNSGGPLLDSAGRLIGINTQIVSPSGASAGVGFSVPVEMVNTVASQIIKYGKVVRPGLGVAVAREEVTRDLGLEGALILEVTPGGGAEKAGLKGSKVMGRRIILGDVIQSIDGVPVSGFEDLAAILDERKVGDTVTVGVFRGGAVKKIQVTLVEIQ